MVCENVLIVLGGGLADNDELNLHTKLRYDKAIEIESNYYKIICSSNKTYKKRAEEQQISEAEAGKRYLVSKGVDASKIFLEDVSRDTFSNSYFCRKMFLDDWCFGRIDVLTSEFHMEKTEFLFGVVFPKEEFNVNFISVENGYLEDDGLLRNRRISERELIKFYQKHLFTTYGIKIGDMKSIENFMLKFNFAMCGKKDKHHEELTKRVTFMMDLENMV